MSTVKVRFLRSHDIFGLLIRIFTWSKWNHVAIEVDGWAYEAMVGRGVRRINDYFYPKWDSEDSISVDVPDSKKATFFLEEQLGKKYDWMAIFAYPFRTSWQSPHRWFCSELVAKALIEAGHEGIRKKTYRITPRDLWDQLGQK